MTLVYKHNSYYTQSKITLIVFYHSGIFPKGIDFGWEVPDKHTIVIPFLIWNIIICLF